MYGYSTNYGGNYNSMPSQSGTYGYGYNNGAYASNQNNQGKHIFSNYTPKLSPAGSNETTEGKAAGNSKSQGTGNCMTCGKYIINEPASCAQCADAAKNHLMDTMKSMKKTLLQHEKASHEYQQQELANNILKKEIEALSNKYQEAININKQLKAENDAYAQKVSELTSRLKELNLKLKEQEEEQCEGSLQCLSLQNSKDWVTVKQWTSSFSTFLCILNDKVPSWQNKIQNLITVEEEQLVSSLKKGYSALTVKLEIILSSVVEQKKKQFECLQQARIDFTELLLKKKAEFETKDLQLSQKALKAWVQPIDTDLDKVRLSIQEIQQMVIKNSQFGMIYQEQESGEGESKVKVEQEVIETLLE